MNVVLVFPGQEDTIEELAASGIRARLTSASLPGILSLASLGRVMRV